jgi:SAM-dependent methyltransferase
MRIKTNPGELKKPQIDPSDVMRFFAERAEKAKKIGSLRAVIYQDKHPDLAERRDVAEKSLLLPMLRLQASDRVLDIGCGTGRWTAVIAPQVARYHGTDFSADLIEIARAEHGGFENVCFSVLPSVSVNLKELGEAERFDKIVVFGLLIYLNDDDVIETLRRVANVAAPQCYLLIREPVAIGERLTIKEHFSDDLDQIYNAIYRTEEELLAMTFTTLGLLGFVLVDKGYVYEQKELCNRADTVQKWYAFAKRETFKEET